MDEWGLPDLPEKPVAKKAPPKKAAPKPKILSVAKSTRPTPESELTPEQREIRNLKDQLAKVQGSKDPEQALAVPEQDGENILIHFVADGLTALGKSWYRGQELEITVGSQSYEETCDRTGFSWLSLRDDDFAQMARWGKVYFHVGPWRGKGYKDGANAFEDLKGVNAPTEEELEKAQALENSRRRAAPLLPKD